jgi:hypothetical protein
MERASIEPEEDVERSMAAAPAEETTDERLSAFKDFVNGLDLDDLDTEED